MSEEMGGSDSSGQEGMEVYQPENESESEPDIEECREIRTKYREIISKTQAKGQEDDSVLNESFNKAEELFIRVKKPREAIYDSTLVNLQASILKRKIQSLHANLFKFKPEEFAARFETCLNNSKFGTPRKRSNSEMFLKFGKVSRRVMPIHPPFCPLFSTLEKGNTVIVKKNRQTKQKDDEISKVIQKPKMFYFHFKEPIAYEQMKNVKLHGNYSQSILSLDENDWKTIVKEFDIKESLIKRNKPKQ